MIVRKWWKQCCDTFFPQVPITAGELQAYITSSVALLRLAALLGWVLIFILLMVCIRLATKQPVVIRSDVHSGEATVIQNFESNNAVQDVEIYAFAKDFLRSFLEINSFTIEKELAQSMNMMTEPFQRAYKDELQKNEFIRKVRKAHIQRDLEITKIAITARTNIGFEIDVRGELKTKPLDSETAPLDRVGILGQLYLAKIPKRTEHFPYGMLVSNFQWREVPLNEVYEPQQSAKVEEHGL